MKINLYLDLLEYIITKMLELAFSVSVETQPNETIKIVGAIPSLGSWNVHHALPLYLSKNVWEGQSIEVNAGRHYLT